MAIDIPIRGIGPLPGSTMGIEGGAITYEFARSRSSFSRLCEIISDSDAIDSAVASQRTQDPLSSWIFAAFVITSHEEEL